MTDVSYLILLIFQMQLVLELAFVLEVLLFYFLMLLSRNFEADHVFGLQLGQVLLLFEEQMFDLLFVDLDLSLVSLLRLLKFSIFNSGLGPAKGKMSIVC